MTPNETPDNRQSIHNYVYDRRREHSNDNPAPPPRNNSFDFTDRNTNFSESSSGMYNSYVSSYQPSDSYRNTYGNDSQPQQKNNASAYREESAPVVQDMAQEHNAVEIPMSDKIGLSVVIALVSVIGGIIVMILASMLMNWLNVPNNVSMTVIGILFFMAFLGVASFLAAGSAIDRRQNLRVCKTPVKGRLVGYDSYVTHHNGHRRTKSAPKYEIFINNRYEIRTVKDFERGKTWEQQINLLANPNGPEIIPATKADIPSDSTDMITAIFVVAVTVIICGIPILLMIFTM